MNPKCLPSLPLACCFLLLIGVATIKHANAESDDPNPNLSLCLDCMLRIKDAMDEVDDMLTAIQHYLVDECDAMDTAVTQICLLNVKNAMSAMQSIFDTNYNDTWICHPACDLTDSNNALDNLLLRPKLFGPGKKSSNKNKKLIRAAMKAAASISDEDKCDQCREKAFDAKGNVVQLLNDCDLILLDACFMNPPVLAENCLNAGKAYTEFNSNFQVGRICKPVC